MNKRILCFLLAVVMLLSVALAGCSKKDGDEAVNETSQKALEGTVTLSMYLMSEEEVSDDKVEEIEAAVNKITKSKFKAQIELRYFTEDQYNEALEKAFEETEDAREAKKKAEAALKEAIKKGEVTTAKTEKSTEAATIINEYGVSELKYPSIEDYQVDIFYLGGYDSFEEFYGNKWLARLDDEISGTSKLISDYVSPNYLTYSKAMENGTYAIPNNASVGEYTYMLLHKEALDEWTNIPKNFTNLTCSATQDLLYNVSIYNSDKFVPLWSGTGELDVSHVNYYGMDDNGKITHDFSVIGGTVPSSFKYGAVNNYYPAGSIFADTAFTDQVRTLTMYKEYGYYGTEADEGKPFAVGYMKGTPRDIEQYEEDYEIVVVEKPTLTTEDVFANAFAVGAYTTSVSKSMQIITYLNTNEDFRNLILYGIEEVDYEIVEKEYEGKTYKTVQRIADDYQMALEKTGNVLIAYPLDTDIPDVREYQKKQIGDLFVSLDIGFMVSEKDNINLSAMKKVRELSERLYAEMVACETVAEFNAFLGTAGSGGAYDISMEDTYAVLMRDSTYNLDNPNYDEAKNGEGVSFYSVYFSWLREKGIYKDVND